MCGIAGIMDLAGRPIDPAQLVDMTRLVVHRGPDGEGFGTVSRGACTMRVAPGGDTLPADAAVAFGHRRLAIIDLRAEANQPMSLDDGLLSIVFNGEIYNYIELREDLKKAGHAFTTASDTEVILRAYQEWGSTCLSRMNGMWSLAIWDGRQRRLFAARDRFGVKPFYYLWDGQRLLFGSEIKQLVAAPETSRRASRPIVWNFLETGLLDYSNETFFEGIRQLPAGCYLTLDAAPGSTPSIERFWELRAGEPRAVSADEARLEFRSLFADAIRLRMRSDVPVGACLSGGLDSSSIVCLACDQSDADNFHTFSACFDEPEFDERPYMKAVAQRTHAHTRQVFPTARGFWEQFERMIWHQDEPLGTGSGFAQWSVMEAARADRIPVLLDGQGGDETLCGYRKFYFFYLAQLLRSLSPAAVPEAIALFRVTDRSASAWRDASRYLPARFRRARSVIDRVSPAGADRSHLVSLGSPGGDVRARQVADLTTFSLPTLLHSEDRNSMAHAIETRLPFLDYRVAEYAVSLPVPLKLHRGWTKWILRLAMTDVLPETVRCRRTKLGFSTPQRAWLTGDLRAPLSEWLRAPPRRLEDVIDWSRVAGEFHKYWNNAPGSLADTAFLRLLSLGVWAETFDVS